MTADSIETLGNRAPTSRNVSRYARVREWVIRMNVPVEREIDVPPRELGEKLGCLVSVGKRSVSNTDRIDGRNVHQHRVQAVLSFGQPVVEPIVDEGVERGAPR